MATLNVQIRDEMLERLERLAHHQDCRSDQVVVEALLKHLQWHDTQMELWQQTEEAISEADRGEVHSSEQVFSWLDSWGQLQEPIG